MFFHDMHMHDCMRTQPSTYYGMFMILSGLNNGWDKYCMWKKLPGSTMYCPATGQQSTSGGGVVMCLFFLILKGHACVSAHMSDILF